MIQLVILVVGAIVGFAASRALRRPQRAAAAASVARNVSGSLGRRKGLTPPELQRACFSEMVRHVQVDRHGGTRAPARYVLRLHPDDVALVEEARRWFTSGLADALQQAAAEHGWAVDAPIDVAYEADPSRRPGVPSALAVPPDAAAHAPPSAPPPPPAAPTARPALRRSSPRSTQLVVVRSDTGRQVPLSGDVVSLGRSADRDITVDDNRVSRSHLRFERHQRTWTVVDDGSANGTLVRNRLIEPHQPTPIRPGDTVSVGPVDLRIVAVDTDAASASHRADVAGIAPEPGTRALDDSDRNRISREFLPPHGNRR